MINSNIRKVSEKSWRIESRHGHVNIQGGAENYFVVTPWFYAPLCQNKWRSVHGMFNAIAQAYKLIEEWEARCPIED